MYDSAIVIVSEIALALYPILIKTVPTDIATQLVSRLLTFSTMAYALGTKSDVTRTWGDLSSATNSFILGLVTLFHVGSSYYAFQQLSTGVSMSIFYTYPFFNLHVGFLLYNDSINLFQLMLMIVAFVGVILVAPEIKEGFTDHANDKKTEYDWKAVLAGLAAAFSETVMYFAVKQAPQPNAIFSILQLYPGALFALLAIIFVRGTPIDMRPSVWLPMILFNALIGFVGYGLRFYAIPHLTTSLFSILSFIGVVAAFIWGYLFVQEIPSLKALIGATLITGAVGLSGAPA